ncbi:MAG: M48 family metallopeptidase [Smithella sp.]|nr:M48 family metallopeptidase [Smithella sp.]
MISKNAKEYIIRFGKEQIKIYLSIQERKTIKICVHPNKTVDCYAPKGKKIKDILNKISKRAPWIIKQKDYFERFQPPVTERRYISGESHYYLGRQYRLKVHKNSKRNVKLIGKFIHVYIPDINNPSDARSILYKWYAKHALCIFERHIESYRDVIKKLNVGYPELKIRKMQKRWGSCGKSGDIVLNTELIKAPLYCIDYVILHEICHLKISSHDYRFFRLLEKFMPDWKHRKERLEHILI